MPNSFFSKLNTLVQSQINDIINPIDEKSSRSRRKALSRMDIQRGLQDDVQTLQTRVNDALKYQDDLQAKVDNLYREVADWDAKADAAVANGREDEARNALGRMQQAQRQLEMVEADLQEHRYVTQELISQVNMLDGVVREASQQPEDVTPDESADADKLGDQILHHLDQTRQKLSDLVASYTAKTTDEEPAKPPKMHIIEEPPQPKPEVTHPVDKRKVDDDLSARLARLSKPTDKEE